MIKEARVQASYLIALAAIFLCIYPFFFGLMKMKMEARAAMPGGYEMSYLIVFLVPAIITGMVSSVVIGLIVAGHFVFNLVRTRIKK